MTAIYPTAEMNKKATAFWAIETARMEKRMADRVLRDLAFATLNAEWIKGTPARYQTTLESALFDAENNRNVFSKDFSQKGGKAKKTDTLQDLILTFVGETRRISLKSLEKKIRAEERHGTIEEVTDGKIHFIDHNGRSKSAPLSGLKHRLSRARKKLQNP
jgi:hypothetical protein